MTLNTSTYALVSSDFDGIQVINLASPDVSVFSNNTNNPSYAKTGDSLSITLMATDIIGSGSATILGLDADVSHVDENFTASVIVPSGFAVYVQIAVEPICIQIVASCNSMCSFWIVWVPVSYSNSWNCNDLNTSKIGSTAIFTYTAKPDGTITLAVKFSST